jgi:hypothetical protein
MKNIVPRVFKLGMVAVISAGIFFLLSSDDKLQDQAVASSLNFLGNKLLAMVPQDESKHVHERYKMLEEEALQGKVDPEVLQDFAVTVLNAEAEGKKLPPRQIDSLIAAVRRSKVMHIETRRMERLASRLKEFEAFQYQFHELHPVIAATSDSSINPPVYRLSPQFTIRIDSARLAMGSLASIPPTPSFSESTIVNLVAPPGAPEEKAMAIRKLSEEMRDLKIEIGRIELDVQFADSMKKRVEKIQQRIQVEQEQQRQRAQNIP